MAKREMLETESLEVELLKEKVENLKSKIEKPKTSEELFQERVQKYESSQKERDTLKSQIEKRRLEIMQEPELLGKARWDEVILLESWERRAKNVEKIDPNFAIILRNNIARKKRDIKTDTSRG